MATNKLGLTRDQLASFLGDFEQIKQFEKLFSTVDNIDTVVIDEVNISAGTANATANEALALISVLSDQTALLSLAPPDLGGTVTSVGLSGGTTGLTISGPNPITTSGTFIIGGTLGIANGGTGATTAASARANLGAAASGANSDITSLSGITGGISSPDYIQFDTAAGVTVGQGQLAWNAADGTLDLGMGYDAVTQQIGLEQYFRIKASAAITDGQCVMFTGSVGASGVLTGAPATGVTNPQYIMGVATMNIANNAFGYITSFGLVRGINTTGSSVGETWVDGDILYYNPSYTGGLTKVPPTAPTPKIVVASVVNAGPGGSGSLFVRVQGEPDLHNLSDVYAPSPISNGQILIGDGPQSRWEATTLTAGSGVSITNGAGSVTISATGSGGTVTSVSVVSANGLAGTVANPTTTPAITLSTTVTGIVKGNGTALSAASAGTDYVAPGAITTSGLTMATSRLLGRTTASTGAVEEISVAGGLTLSGGVLTGTSGTVTSVSGTGTVNGITLTGTVTSSGSLTLGGTLSNVSLTTQVTGTLPIANGGTNATTASGARTSLGATTVGSNFFTLTNPSAITFPRINADNSVSTLDAATFRTAIGAGTGNGSVTSVDVSGGTTGLTTSGGPITGSGTITLAGTLVAANGGTGQTSYTIGDILYASGTTTLSKLADVATGNALISGGVGAAPSYGKIGLTTHVSGTLPVANGGTGATTLTSGYLVKGNGTSAVSASVVYDDGTNIGIGTTATTAGYGSGKSLMFINQSSVLFQNASNTWNTSTAGGAITYFSDNNLYIDAKDSTSNIYFRVNGANIRLQITSAGALVCVGVYNTTVGATNRDVFVDSSGNIGYVSSIRASKTNIKDLSDTAWLDALRPVTFNYRQRNEDGKYTSKPEKHLEYGLIAEEVVEVNPELVFYDDTESGPELRGVSYSKLIIPLLKEIQSLRARVAKLEGE